MKPDVAAHMLQQQLAALLQLQLPSSCLHCRHESCLFASLQLKHDSAFAHMLHNKCHGIKTTSGHSGLQRVYNHAVTLDLSSDQSSADT